MLNYPQFKEFQKSLTIIYFALLVGLVFFALVSLAIHTYGDGMVNAQIRTIGFIAVPLVVLAGYVSSRFISARLLKKAQMEQDIEEKFNLYRTAVIARLSLLEAAGFFAIIVFLLTGERLFLGFLGVLLFYYITLMPSEPKIISELDPEEDTNRDRR